MLLFSKKIAIFGTGGLAKEVFYCISDILRENNISAVQQVVFVVKENAEQLSTFLNCPIIAEKDFSPTVYTAVLAIGNLFLRKKIYESLPKETQFPVIIHPTAQVNETSILGKGSIVMANAIVSCDITIGDFCVIDRAANVGHDCKLGSYVHLAPMSVLSGNVTVGCLVYFGTQSAVREGIAITDVSTIGMGGIVVKDIVEKGIYAGNPVKKIKE